MKAKIRNVGVLLILLLAAIAWTVLMSLNVSSGGRKTAIDGARVSVSWIDQRGPEFPRLEVHLSVLAGDGEPLSGLPESAFELREDDVTVDIQSFIGAGEQTVASMLVIDRSGSMGGDKIVGARNAANAFIDQMRSEQDNAGIIAFGDSVATIQPLTNDQDALRQAVSGVRANGGTLFYDAVYEGIAGLSGRNDGRRIVMALTDGMDTGSRHTPDNIIQLAQSEGIAVYTIGLGEEGWWIFTGLDSETLQRIAVETGGEYHHAPSSSELAALYKRIAQAVQNEYVLGYDSPSPNLDGTTRHVAITIDREDGDLLARGDYSVSGVISSSFNLEMFVPLFLGIFLLLLLLLFLPALWGRWRRWRKRRAAAVPPPIYQQQPVYPPPAPNAGYCSRCHHPIKPGVKFCNSCGQLVTVMSAPPPLAVNCRHCGSALRTGAKFCVKCGQ